MVRLLGGRSFINPRISEQILNSDMSTEKVFSYFVNETRFNKKSIPYSFIAGIDKNLYTGLGNNEILINEWAAEELGAKKGDTLILKYFSLGVSSELLEDSTAFIVKQVIPINGFAGDPTLMPDFKGLSDSENCTDWHPGIPINLDLISKKDEDYWDRYKGTPKAFINIDTARQIWANRFGDLTSIRFSANEYSAESLSGDLIRVLELKQMGYTFLPIRERAVSGATDGVDFGTLFIGLSFFIILSAMILTGLQFALSIQQRKWETDQLLAVGISHKTVYLIRFIEGAVIAFLASILGSIFSAIYARIVLFGLGEVWHDAVGINTFELDPQFSTMVIGFSISLLTALAAIIISVRGQLRRTNVKLQEINSTGMKKNILYKVIFSGSSIALLILLTIFNTKLFESNDVAVFFIMGILLLGLLLYLINQGLRMLSISRTGNLTLIKLTIINIAKNRRKSMASISMLAAGIFIVISVGSNQLDALKGSHLHKSGTGGFEIIVETALPVLTQSMGDQNGLSVLDDQFHENSKAITQIRVRDGEDASCLNITRTASPGILGVNSKSLAGRFNFAKTNVDITLKEGWDLLNINLGDGVIPAVADLSVIKWGLGLSLGDTLYYPGKYGSQLKVVLVGGLSNSIFQGSIIISEENFVKHFTGNSGFRLFLFDTDNASEIVARSQKYLSDFGAETSSCVNRLADFNAVENTYLSIFLLLGSIGLLIGTLGFWAVIMRNILEKQRELGIMKAIGYRTGKIYILLFKEYLFVLLAGVFIGFSTAAVAIRPVMESTGNALPIDFIFLTIAVIIVTGISGILWSVRIALKQPLIRILQTD
ncbi:MAG: ABC transporter permease [Candidatus Marinimicrobia bacterium]|nr:ABC transporter permease [Candidatus Neomarinimicrobiota bacterium]MBT4172898.1 ABC transporter permease [Candidatus Neomarinimicrobiota bacterium]MBT4537536.1 ABC transporter permease [Candidatus Neomarinimicrobiota bacterium]MBT4851008.1 ABC transporter permease [Candidatus Neomarinimicrobiota bacterium]